MTATPSLPRAAETLGSAPLAPDDLRARRGADRLADLAARTASLRGARTGLPPERWLVVGGAVAIPLGVLLILLGWYGSAKTAVPFEQTPYLISGGLLGLALVVLGSALYFAHWMTTLVRESRADRALALASAERLEAVLTRLAELADEPPAPVVLPRDLRADLLPDPVAEPVPVQRASRAAGGGGGRSSGSRAAAGRTGTPRRAADGPASRTSPGRAAPRRAREL